MVPKISVKRGNMVFVQERGKVKVQCKDRYKIRAKLANIRRRLEARSKILEKLTVKGINGNRVRNGTMSLRTLRQSTFE